MKRRKLLKNSALGLFFGNIISTLPEFALAADPAPKRLILLFHPLGMSWDSWASGSNNGLTLGATLQPLERHIQDMLVLKGVNAIRSKGHMSVNPYMNEHFQCHHAVWTGGSVQMTGSDWNEPNSPSIDVLLAPELNTLPKHRMFQVGTQSDQASGGSNGVEGHISTASGRKALRPILNPTDFFNTVFPNGTPSNIPPVVNPNPTVPTPTQPGKGISRANLLNGMLRDYKEISQNLGAESKRLLQADIDAFSDLEKAIANANVAPTPIVGGMPMPQPAVLDGISKPDIAGLNLRDSKDHLKIARLQWKTCMGAFRADEGRVASFMFGGGSSGLGIKWIPNTADFPLNSQYAGKGDYHNYISHTDQNGGEQNSARWIAEIVKCYAMEIANMIDDLKKTPEINGNGMMFDNTTIVWCSELSDPVHGTGNLPYVIFNGSQGGFATNRFMNVGADTSDVLLTIAKSMNSKITKVGASEGVIQQLLK